MEKPACSALAGAQAAVVPLSPASPTKMMDVTLVYPVSAAAVLSHQPLLVFQKIEL